MKSNPDYTLVGVFVVYAFLVTQKRIRGRLQDRMSTMGPKENGGLRPGREPPCDWLLNDYLPGPGRSGWETSSGRSSSKIYLAMAVSSTLSMAHHQSFPASNKPKVRTIFLAPAGASILSVTVSFVA